MKPQIRLKIRLGLVAITLSLATLVVLGCGPDMANVPSYEDMSDVGAEVVEPMGEADGER